MMKCNLCGKEFDSKRAVHGHMIGKHYAEYKAAGCDQSAFVEGISNAKPIKYERSLGVHISSNRPAGFRLLDKRQSNERMAYDEGYRYIDANDIVYDAAEVAAERWV